MSQTAVLVWLSASSLLPTFHAEIEGYANSRLVRLEAPRENAAPLRSSAYAVDVVAELEGLLEEARRANASLEPGRALGALERTERLLREHPELPQSAWLMAEVLQLSAGVEGSAPEGSDAARSLEQRAATLEGARAMPFSDRATAKPSPHDPGHAFSVSGLEPGDSLEWDGTAAVARTLHVAPGEHHARVTRNGRLIYASWATVSESDAELRLPVPETVPCSADDVGQSRFENGRALPAPHARCESYVLARAHAGGGIEAARCERETCGKVVVWQRVLAARPSPPRRASGEREPRVWPYAVAATAGALLVTGIVLWRAGVFDRDEGATRQTWTFSGPPPKPMGFNF